MQSLGSGSSNGWCDRHPLASMTIISPGSTSRTKCAPTVSRAGLSEATTHPLSNRPRHSGQNPSGPRTPIRWLRSIATNENPPRSFGRTRSRAHGSSPPSGAASLASSNATSSATRSLSLVTVPSSIPASSASSAVLTRFPL